MTSRLRGKERRAASSGDLVVPMNRGWFGFALGLLLLYATATFSGEGAFWGLNAYSFFSSAVRATILLVSALFLFPAFHTKVFHAVSRILKANAVGQFRWWILSAFAAVVAAFLLASNSIRTDIFGDGRNMLQWYGNNLAFDSAWIKDIFSVHLFTVKYPLTVFLHRTVSHVFDIPIAESYRVVSSIAGGAYLLLWLAFLRTAFSTSPFFPVLVAGGIFLGSNQMFFGHIENYPVAFLCWTAFLVVCFLFFEQKARLWHVFALFAVSLKTHTIAIVFLPALVYLLLWHFARDSRGKQLLRPRATLLLIVLPTLLLAVILYFFYFKSYNQPHWSPTQQFEHAFLPIFPSAPPLDGYTLQSWNHLLDFGNVLLLNGSPLLPVLLWYIFARRRNIEWAHPRVVFGALCAFFSSAFFLTLNPELSMPRDWDLFTLAIPALVFLLVVVIAHSAPGQHHGRFGLALTGAFFLYPLGFFIVNASPDKLSHRLESLGERVYRTSYAGASYIISVAHSMETDHAAALQRRIAVVNRLEPIILAEDNQYAHLLSNVAASYAQQRDYRSAVSWMERASQYSPGNGQLRMQVTDLYLQTGQNEQALQSAEILLRADSTSADALVRAGLASGRLGNHQTALQYFEAAARLAPGNDMIRRLLEQARATIAGDRQ